jgi:DUF4097 and DUF4098 domain-containing protein YvlB
MIRNALTPALFFAAAALSAPAAAQQDIDKVNGSITAEAGQTVGDLGTVNGSIRLQDAARAGDAETVNGSIRAGDDVAADSLATVNGSIRIGRRAEVAGGIETVNGSIFVDHGGRVGKDVATVNGAIGLVSTEVGGDVETVTGDVTIGVGSHVRGGIRVHKPTSNWMPINISKRAPRIIIGPDAVVEGPLVFEREVVLYVHDTARVGEVTGATPVPYSGATAPRD